MYPTAYRAAARAAGYAAPRGGFQPAGRSATPILDALLSDNLGAMALAAALEGLGMKRPGAARGVPDVSPRKKGAMKDAYGPHGAWKPLKGLAPFKLALRGMPSSFTDDPVAAGPERPDGYRQSISGSWQPVATGCDYPNVDPLVCGPWFIEGIADCLGGQAGWCENTEQHSNDLMTKLQAGEAVTGIALVYVYDPPSSFVDEQRFYSWAWSKAAGDPGLPLPAFVPAKRAPVVPEEALRPPRPQPATESGPGGSRGYNPPPPAYHQLEPPGPRRRDRKFYVSQGMGALVKAAVNSGTEALDFLDELHDALPEKYKCRTPKKHSVGKRGQESRSCSPLNKAKALYKAIPKLTSREAEEWLGEAVKGVIQNEVEDRVIGKMAKHAGKSMGESGINFPLAGPAL